MRLLCRNKIYDVAVSHQLTAERTGYQCRGRGGGGGGDFIAPAPYFTFCILAEYLQAALLFVSCTTCAKSFIFWFFVFFDLLSSASLDMACFLIFCHFCLFFPYSLLVLFNVLLVLLHPQFKIILALMTCNLKFELLTASLNKPHTKYLDKSSRRILMHGSAHYLYVDYTNFLTINAVRDSNVGVI